MSEERFVDMEERFAVFAAAMAPGNPPLLRALEEKARADGVPVIRQGTQSLIRFLLELKKPQRILEVGTGVGFSALLMLDALHGACEITTIEKDPARAAEAERNFAEAGGKIRLFRGDAEEILRQLAETEPESYDFVFMDAAKGQYIHFLPRIVELTRAGGLLLSDPLRCDEARPHDPRADARVSPRALPQRRLAHRPPRGGRRHGAERAHLRNTPVLLQLSSLLICK